ncbi:MAG: DUF2971 domain-containing protein [Bacteroidaceae bacterium]|nr:DUF2971 domain-containing protein [Bacteroidaceae bacterium]
MKKNEFYESIKKHEIYLNAILTGGASIKQIIDRAKKTEDERVSNFYNDKKNIINNIYNRHEELCDLLDSEDIVDNEIKNYSYVISAFVYALILSDKGTVVPDYLDSADKLIAIFSKKIKNTNDNYTKNMRNTIYIKSQLYWILSECWNFLGKPYEYKCIEAKKRSNYYTLLSEDSKPIATAYSFRKCTTFLYQALINEKLNLSSPYQFNDPMDCPIKDIVNETSKKAFKDCVKIACFIKGDEYNNLLMWPHYADSHKGICIKYNFSSFDLSQINNEKSQKVAFFKDIEYNNDKLKNGFSAKKTEEGTSINDAFFLKSEVWKYESELRLLYYDVNGKGDYATIDAPNCIEAIYFGYKCSDKDKKTIHEILKYKTVKIKDEKGNLKSENIKFYQMEIDKDNFGQIKAVDYNPD